MAFPQIHAAPSELRPLFEPELHPDHWIGLQDVLDLAACSRVPVWFVDSVVASLLIAAEYKQVDGSLPSLMRYVLDMAECHGGMPSERELDRLAYQRWSRLGSNYVTQGAVVFPRYATEGFVPLSIQLLHEVAHAATGDEGGAGDESLAAQWETIAAHAIWPEDHPLVTKRLGKYQDGAATGYGPEGVSPVPLEAAEESIPAEIRGRLETALRRYKSFKQGESFHF